MTLTNTDATDAFPQKPGKRIDPENLSSKTHRHKPEHGRSPNLAARSNQIAENNRLNQELETALIEYNQ